MNRFALSLALVPLAAAPLVAQEAANHFASIFVDGKRIGRVHYTVHYGDEGEVEELRTRASMSVLGFEVYHLTQHLHEAWAGGELQSLRGTTDDDGERYEASLERTAEEYAGVLNGEPLSLPRDAFPASVWHHAITEQSLLIDLRDLRLMKVDVEAREETIEVSGAPVAASRFDFSGDWRASVWFDRDRQLVKFEYEVDGHDVVITLDQD